MLMTLGHCVVVRTFLVLSLSTGGPEGGGPAAGVLATCGVSMAAAWFSWLFAMMIWALAKAFLCASRACFLFSAIALPAATHCGFFCFGHVQAFLKPLVDLS